MYIIYVRSFRKKIILFSAVLLFWIAMFYLSSFFLNNSLILNVTINDQLMFSYPYAFEVDGIYVNEQLDERNIETNSSFKRPITEKVSNYTSLKGKFSFSYPSLFTLNQQEFAGSDILYHIDFHNKQQTTHGFVQVWNLPYPLDDFLKKSQSTSQQNYKYFDSKPIAINDLSGFFWDYIVLGTDGKYYKGCEVFLKRDDKMYRMSYFVPEKLWDKEQSEIFWSMVKSFKTF